DAARVRRHGLSRRPLGAATVLRRERRDGWLARAGSPHRRAAGRGLRRGDDRGAAWRRDRERPSPPALGPRAAPDARARVRAGWGIAPAGPGNAIELADTPVFDRLWHDYPHAQLDASGEAVGLPDGQMGNSEVGHLTIGSGRILFQDLVRVNRAIESGDLFENEALRGAFARGENVHLLGLVSHGGVHSHVDHLQALLTFAPEKTWIHAFT